MKKLSHLLLVVLVFTCAISTWSATANAAVGDVSVGAIAMYGWWNPFAKNYFKQQDRKMPIRSTFSMKDSSALYGPVLTWQATESWKLSFTLLMALHNQFSLSSDNLTLGLTGLHLARTTASRVEKYDADLRAYKKMNKYVDIFIAANVDVNKFFGGYNAIISFVPVLPIEVPMKGSLRSFQYDCGPGFGFNLGFELAKNLTLDLKLSLYVMAGTLQRNVQFEARKTNVHLGFKSIEEVVLSYLIEPANIILSVGGRYQLMTFALITQDPREYFGNYTALFDQLGGVTVSAAYLF